MTPSHDVSIMNSSLQFVSDHYVEVTQNTVSIHSHLSAVSQNTSFQHECDEIRFSDMDYIPWNNSDNIVNAEVEETLNKIKDNMIGLMFLIGGPANVINMAVFYKQGLKDRVNLCLFALSLADELYLTVNMLLHGEQLHLQFTSTERFGPIATFLININFIGFVGVYSVSPVISAIIAIERCYCVLRPLKFQTVMRTRTMAAIIIAVYVIVVGLFWVVALRYHVGCVNDPETGVMFKTLIVGTFYRDHKQFIDILDGIIFGVALPGVVMITVITATTITVFKLRQIVTWRSETTSSLSAREIALTKMLVGNSILFIACVSPVALSRFSWLFFPEVNAGRRNHNFYLTCLWVSTMCCLINSSFNIFVYYSMVSRYRETFWALFSRKSKIKQTVKKTASNL